MSQEIEKIIKKYGGEVKEKIKKAKKEFKRHTGVLLEEFQSQVKTVAEGVEMLSDKMGRVESKFDGVESNIEIIKTVLPAS